MVKNSTNIPFTVTGGVSGGSPVTMLSGFTCALTTFQLTVSSQLPTNPSISNDKFVWNLGDGTIIKGVSAEHIYNMPGIYNVSVVGYDGVGNEYLSTQTEQISVTDFFDTKLVHRPTDVINTISIPAGRLQGRSNTPINVDRYTSHQPHDYLKGTGYTLTLYASGSPSKRLNITTHNSDKWAHVDQTWSFYKAVTADNQSVSYKPIEQVETTSEKIYYERKKQLFYYEDLADWLYDDRCVRVPASQVSTTPGSVFVGTSGTGQFYYGDDRSRPGDGTIFAYISLENFKIPDQRETVSGRYSNINTAKYREASKTVIPIVIRPSTATQLVFTRTGMSVMPLSGAIWQMTETPFFINLSDITGSIVEDYPPLTINTPGLGGVESLATNVVNLSVISSTNQLLSANFYRYVDAQLPRSLSGCYRGFFVPADTGDSVQVVGRARVNRPQSYTKNCNVIWTVNPQHNKLYHIVPSYDYMVNDISGLMTVTQGTTGAKTLSADSWPISVVPNSNAVTDNNIKAHLAFSTSDTISSYDIYGTCISATDLTNVYFKDIPQVTSLNDYTQPLSLSGLSPSCIAVDGNRDFWVTMHDAGIVTKFRESDHRVIELIQNTDNVTYTQAQTGSSGFVNQGLGGFNTIEPGIVDTDTENNIWVAYTNPLSSSIRKYDSTGASITAINFSEGFAPSDIVVDGDNNVWVTIVNQFREPRETFNTTVTAYADPTVWRYYIDTDLSDLQVGEVIDSQWNIWDKHFNGKHLITKVDNNESGWFAEVTPYTGRRKQVREYTTSTVDVATVSATQIKVYPSDFVCKFDSTGTKVSQTSGFMKPGYITLDTDQRPWITHDSNTVTQLNTDGTIKQHIRVESGEFLTNIAPTYDLATFDSSQLGGIGGDTFGRVFVISSYENKLFYIPSATPSLSSSHIIDPEATINSNMHRAYGDWTGFRWLNKYARTGGVATLSGSTTVNIYPSGGKYKLAKINEDFDPSDTIKSYRFQDQLFSQNDFFDNFYGQIVGTLSGEPTSLGRAVYEKIANFPMNMNDVDTCNVAALYSLYDQHDLSMSNYNFSFPPSLRRVTDLTSVSHSKLWGGRSRFDRDFLNTGNTNAQMGINLGSETSPLTAMITAGIRIVAEQLFNREFRVINPMYVSGADTDPGYDASVKMLSSYPLSAYSPNWGWGLYNDVNGLDIGKYYNFYHYTPNYSEVQVEGVIDWNNPYTNITEHISGMNVWTKEEGIVELMIEHELRKGLNLFQSTLSASTPSLQ